MSNCMIECAVVSVKNPMEVWKSALVSKWPKSIKDMQNISTCVDNAAVLLNRREVCKDSKTAYERLKGKRGGFAGVASGEKIMFKEPRWHRDAQALSSLWSEGIFLALRPVKGEFMVGDCKDAC